MDHQQIVKMLCRHTYLHMFNSMYIEWYVRICVIMISFKRFYDRRK